MTHLTNRFDHAITYARDVHAADVRKGTTVPYIAHLLAVSSIVLEHGGDEDQAIASLLHDTAEDHGGEPRLADIAATFGAGVAEIVAHCSDSLLAEGEKKEDWWIRKVRYLDHARHVPPRSLLVAAADKLHNARSILHDLRERGDVIWARFNAGREGTLWYYRGLADLYEAADLPRSLVAEIRRTVEALVAEAGVQPHEERSAAAKAADAAARLARSGRDHET
ncbi:MAG TPA: HD domain-containing protein [Acidimicrobiales bacterium]|jgi:(p)ppGpp synthase/HD superfamily hydrolase|nr:HD domain-containing protein [Acidimicrobiales bacterium]